MTGIIWGYTEETAKNKLKEIEENYKLYHTAEILIRRKNEIIFNNGDRWIASGARESSRGRRCNISYIDVRIEQDFIDTVIKHCTTAGPYHAFNYYFTE